MQVRLRLQPLPILPLGAHKPLRQLRLLRLLQPQRLPLRLLLHRL